MEPRELREALFPPVDHPDEAQLPRPSTNPLLRWQETLREARVLLDGEQPRQAEALLNKALEEARVLRGPGVDLLLPITLQYLGEARFAVGRVTEAVDPLDGALTLFRRGRRPERQQACLRALIEVQRYLGEVGAAADSAQQLAQLLQLGGDREQARRTREWAERIRGGEPLCRVVVEMNGQAFEVDDVPLDAGGARFRFVRNRVTLPAAKALVRRGERLASALQHREALDLFRHAAELDPHDPQARYLEALSLMQLRAYGEAQAAYAATDRLAPGWFHCRADGWLAQQAEAGKFAHETWLTIRALEDVLAPPQTKRAWAVRALETAPQLALLHLLKGRQEAALRFSPEARESFQQGLACAADLDVRTRLLLELGRRTPGEEGIRLLESAARLGGNLVSSAMAQLCLKSRLSGPPF
jgi:tetratricopeptide (TPR) repeat protein